MTPTVRTNLESLHQDIGQVLQMGRRLMAAVICLGMLFGMMATGAMQLVRQPEKVLQNQGFIFNYSEMSRVVFPQGDAAVPSVVVAEPLDDPDWDGLLAGASAGFLVGQNIPLVGLVGGPVLGAVIGYQLDSRI